MALPATALQPRTYEDLRAIPDDLHRYELISGEILMSPSPRTKHQRAAFSLATEMRLFAARRRLGEVFVAPFDVIFSRYNVVVPDLLYVSRGHARIIDEDHIHGAPDLIAEVLSPSNRMVDLMKKAALYADHGVPEYWIVDPDAESITVYELRDGLYVARPNEAGVASSAVLPGFEIRSSELFAVPEWMTDSDNETE